MRVYVVSNYSRCPTSQPTVGHTSARVSRVSPLRVPDHRAHSPSTTIQTLLNSPRQPPNSKRSSEPYRHYEARTCAAIDPAAPRYYLALSASRFSPPPTEAERRTKHPEGLTTDSLSDTQAWIPRNTQIGRVASSSVSQPSKFRGRRLAQI